MSTCLAVMTTEVGASFVNRHIWDVYPGRSVVVAKASHVPTGCVWNDTQSKILYLDRWRNRLSVRLRMRLGASEDRLRDSVIRKFFDANSVSVVLGEYLDYFLDYVPLLNRLGIPYVVQSHGMDASAALKIPGVEGKYLAYRTARAVLTRCELHRQRLIRMGLPAEKIFINRGGVDVPLTMPQRSGDSANRMLAVGQMKPKKSPIYLLEAFRRAALRDPDIRLDYIGGGPLFPAAAQLVDAMGLNDRITLHGAATDELKFRLLQECGVFLQHSVTDKQTGDEEGLPAAIQEAMAHGQAIVSTRHAGIPEAVRHGVNGFLVEECDVAGMSEAILSVRERVAQFGRESHSLALEENTWDDERSRLRQFLALEG